MATEIEYRSKFAISQSAIKDWKEMTPAKWHATWVTKTLRRAESAATTVGSYLDCLRFTPDQTEKRFLVAEAALPSAKVRAIIDELISHVNTLNKNAKALNDDPASTTKVALKKHTLEDKELVMSLCQKHDHFATKLEQAYNDVLKKGTAYFDLLKIAKGRKVISPADHALATELNNILITDPISKG